MFRRKKSEPDLTVCEVFLFTSNYAEYFKDVLEILALPSGVPFRFRYKGKYVTDAAKRNLKKIKSKPALVCLKDLTGGSERMIPLRRVILQGPPLVDDEFYIFDFVLDKFPITSNSDVKAFFEFGNSRFTSEKFVYCDGYHFSVNVGDNQTVNWKAIVDLLANYGKFDQSIFLRATAPFYSSRKRENASVQIKDNRFSLKGGNNFRIEIFHYFPIALYQKITGERNPQELVESMPALDTDAKQSSLSGWIRSNHRIKMTYSSELIVSILTEDVIEGQYQLHQLDFTVTRLSQHTDSIIFLGPVIQDEKFYTPRITIPIRAKRSWNRESVFLSLTAVGLLLAGLTDLVIKTCCSTVSFPVFGVILTIVSLVLGIVSRWPKK